MVALLDLFNTNFFSESRSRIKCNIRATIADVSQNDGLSLIFPIKTSINQSMTLLTCQMYLSDGKYPSTN